MLEYTVTYGNIASTAERFDAICTLINSGKSWFGGVDNAIKSVAGRDYHQWPMRAAQLVDGEVIISRGNSRNHNGNFHNVIFVVDDFMQPLSDLVYLALNAASEQGYRNVALPLMRSGLALGQYETSIREIVTEMKKGINRFLQEVDNVDVTVVIYNDENAERLFFLP